MKKKIYRNERQRNDNVVLTRVFSNRSYISEKSIYQKFMSKILFI